MELNLGRLDIMIRATIGVMSVGAGAYMAFYMGNVYGLALGFMGGILLMTAMMRWCPVYALLGFNSCPISGHRL